MTWEELYGQMLDECCTCETCGRGGSSLKTEDPIAYRCGFADYTDSLRDGVMTCDCGNQITDFDVCMDDDVECDVCKGSHFMCEACSEIYPREQHASDEICDTCQEQLDEEEED